MKQKEGRGILGRNICSRNRGRKEGRGKDMKLPKSKGGKEMMSGEEREGEEGKETRQAYVIGETHTIGQVNRHTDRHSIH